MPKLKLESQILERFDAQAKEIAPVVEAQANQVAGVLAKDLIGADFKPNLGLNGIHHYTRPDSYVFWQKVGTGFNNFVKMKPWLSSIFIKPIDEARKTDIADKLARYVGGNAMIIGAAAALGMGLEGRTVNSFFNSQTMAPVMEMMNYSMDKIHMGWFGNSAAAGLVAFGLISLKLGWDAKKHYDNAKFLEGRDQAILDGALAKEKTFMQWCKARFTGKYIAEPEVSQQSLNRIQTMQKMNLSTEKILDLTKRKDEPTFKHIERSAQTLVKDYLVDRHLANQTALSMLVDMKGDTNHLTAILKSRHLPQGWAEKYAIDPRTIVKEEVDVGSGREPLKLEHAPRPVQASGAALSL